MKKYRIKRVEKLDGTVKFFPQYRFLYFFWNGFCGTTVLGVYKTNVSFHSFEKASEHLENFKNSKIKNIQYYSA